MSDDVLLVTLRITESELMTYLKKSGFKKVESIRKPVSLPTRLMEQKVVVPSTQVSATLHKYMEGSKSQEPDLPDNDIDKHKHARRKRSGGPARSGNMDKAYNQLMLTFDTLKEGEHITLRDWCKLRDFNRGTVTKVIVDRILPNHRFIRYYRNTEVKLHPKILHLMKKTAKLQHEIDRIKKEADEWNK